MVALFVSGVTAIPLESEVDLLAKLFGISGLSVDQAGSYFARWILVVRDALHDTSARHPVLYYGTDWLAFGHIVIAIAFYGAVRDPVKNSWLYDFGLVACLLVIPWALVFGAIRGIPFFWRLIDCSFGIFGLVPISLCRKWVKQLADLPDAKEEP